MPKKKTSFYIDDKVLDVLRKLAENSNRSQSNMIEVLILEEAKKLKIKKS